MALPTLVAPEFKTVLPSSKKKVTYRPFLVKEEKLLLMAMESKAEAEMKSAIEAIIRNCTGEEPTDMALVDIEWMFLKLRIASKGVSADYSFKCSECGVQNDKTADLNDVKVMNQDYDTVVKLTSDIGLKMKAPSYELTSEISSEMNTQDIFTIITESIELIYDGEEVEKAADYSKEQLTEFVETFTDAQFEKVRNYFEHMPSLELDIDFSCVSCKAENTLTLKGINDFLA